MAYSLIGYSLMGYSRGTHSWGTHGVLTHGVLTHGVLMGYSLTGYSLIGYSLGAHSWGTHGVLMAYSLTGYSLMGYSWGTHSWGTYSWGTHSWGTHSWGTHGVLTHGVLTHGVLTHGVLTHGVLTHGVLMAYSLTGYSLTGYSLMGYSLMGYSLMGYSRRTHGVLTHGVLTGTHGARPCLCAASTAAGRCSGVRSSTSTRTAATSSLVADGVLTATRVLAVLSPSHGGLGALTWARGGEERRPGDWPTSAPGLARFADALTAAPPPPGTTCGRGADVHGEDQDRSILAAHGEPAARSSLRSGGCRCQRPVVLRPPAPLSDRSALRLRWDGAGSSEL
jgi:hypothetical protein